MNSVFFNSEFRHWKVLCILVLNMGSILIKFVIIGKCSNELMSPLAPYTLLCEYITLIIIIIFTITVSINQTFNHIKSKGSINITNQTIYGSERERKDDVVLERKLVDFQYSLFVGFKDFKESGLLR